MVTAEDLAFVRLAMRRRLVSANKIREAVERKRWDNQDRTLAEILVDMGAIDPKVVTKIASEMGAVGRVTISSARGKSGPPSIPKSDPALPRSDEDADERTEVDKKGPRGLKRIGKYEIIRLIGAGAMGAVYEARDRDLDKVFALKLLQGDGPPTARAIARFRREAKLAARLDHPNIVRVYGAGVEDGHHFIAMDLVDGRSLSELVAIGEVTPRRAIHIARKIALAIGHAHERGVLHRDLKPANVLVDKDGEPRVTDFGLAVLAEPDEGDRLTRTGAAVGTPAYMSPEQARGELSEIDPRTDVYAIGATLYEMLTGGPPFEAPTFLELARKICDQDAPSPRRKNAEVSADLETICLKALEKEKPDRYQTALELASDLARLLEDAPIQAQPPSTGTLAKRWANRHRSLAATLAGACILALGLAARWYRQPAFVLVRSEPSRARVLVDGVPLDHLPQTEAGIRLHAGFHDFRFELEGYEPVSIRKDAARGVNDPVFGVLPRLMGTVKLSSEPAGARVTLWRVQPDGGIAFVASDLQTPVERLLDTGTYRWSVDKPGYVATEGPRTLQVGKNAEETFDQFTLRKDDGSLELDVEPRGAVVHAERGGEAPDLPATDGHVEVKLGAGIYKVSVTKPGYLPWTFEGDVGPGTKRRASLLPLRSFSRTLAGHVVAEPVIADVDADGAPDVLALEEGEDGRRLVLLGGGAERAPRWRVPTDATAILPELGDADRDGTLDVALVTGTGIEVRDGATGDQVLRLVLAPAGSRGEGTVRATSYRAKGGALCVLGAWLGRAEEERVVLAASAPTGWQQLRLVLPPDVRGQLASEPAIVEATALGGLGVQARAWAAFAFPDRIVAFEVPREVGRAADEARAPRTGRSWTVPGIGPDAHLEAIGTDELVVVPASGPLFAWSFAKGERIGAPHGSAASRFGRPRVSTVALLEPKTQQKRPVPVIVAHDSSSGTVALAWERPAGLRLVAKVPSEEAILLPPPDTGAGRPRPWGDVALWARGRLFEPRSANDPTAVEVRERSADAQVWSVDRPALAADLDGDGAAEVLAPSPDGHALVALAPAPSLRWVAQARPVLDAEAADVDGSGEPLLLLLTEDRLLGLSPRDGRTTFSADVPARPRGLATLRAGRSREAVVLGSGQLWRYRGGTGTLRWRKDVPPALSLEAAGACVCGTKGDEEDLVLGDPLGVVSGASDPADGREPVLPWFLQAPTAASVLRPAIVDIGGNRRAIFGRIERGGEAPTAQGLALARLPLGTRSEATPAWAIDATAPTHVAPLPPENASAGYFRLVVVDGDELRVISMNDGNEGERLRLGGRALGMATTRVAGPSPVVVLEESQSLVRGRVRAARVRGLAARTDASGVARGLDTAWVRDLPAGPQPAFGPVLLDDERVAFVAPSGIVVVLGVRDGAWLGERRPPEGELRPWLFAAATSAGSLLLAQTTDGRLLAFEAPARRAEVAAAAGELDRLESDRRAVRELGRRAAGRDEAADRAATDLERYAKDTPLAAAARLALARASLARGDLRRAAEAAGEALLAAPRLAPASALLLRARARLAVQEDRWAKEEKDLVQKLRDLALERPAIASEVAADLAALLRTAKTPLPDAARDLAELAVAAAPADPLAHRERAAARLAVFLKTKRTAIDGAAWAEAAAIRQDMGIAVAAGDSPELAALAADVVRLLRSSSAERAKELADAAVAAAPSETRARVEATFVNVDLAKKRGVKIEAEVALAACTLSQLLEQQARADAALETRRIVEARELLDRAAEVSDEADRRVVRAARSLFRLRRLPTKEADYASGVPTRVFADLREVREDLNAALQGMEDGQVARDGDLYALAALVALGLGDEDAARSRLAALPPELAPHLRDAIGARGPARLEALKKLYAEVKTSEVRRATFKGVLVVVAHRDAS